MTTKRFLERLLDRMIEFTIILMIVIGVLVVAEKAGNYCGQVWFDRFGSAEVRSTK